MSIPAYQPQAGERLVSMLLLTALLHGIVLLGVTFGAGVVGGLVTPGLEVLLVTEDLPEAASNTQARYEAQRTQLGSGNTRTRATSSPNTPPPQAPASSGAQPPGEDDALHSSAPQPVIRFAGIVESAENSPATQPQPTDATQPDLGRGAGDELTLRGDPRTGQWVSADTRASQLAPYLDSWRRKIERLGTLNYPSIARKASLSGAPVIEVALLANGQLQEARVQRSSGEPELDQAALNILRTASPFNPFPAQLAEKYRVLRFAYQWEFVDGRLSTGSVTAPTEGAGDP